MNKSDLVQTVAEKAKMPKTTVGVAVDYVLDAITEALANGEKVRLVGFGTFEVRERAAREARNPRTGETVKIPAAKTPSFKAGRPLKEAVNN